MCIIAAKPAGVGMPSRDTIRTMWDGNRDGAGIMYVENGKVHIEKGFMKYKSFAKMLDKLEARLDLTATPLVMHFRITTHGGTTPENTHPFPITDSIGALQKRVNTVDIGVAHNGIIDICPRKGVSDTMEYIASQLAPLKRALPRFYENKNAMLLIKNAIRSKMAFLTKEGKIYTIGNFIDENGVLYSNDSYIKPSLRYRDLDWGYYYGGGYCGSSYADDSCVDTDYPPFSELTTKDDVLSLQWLDDGDYIQDTVTGKLWDGYEFLIDCGHNVWMYDYEADCAVRIEDATAYTLNGAMKRYDPDLAETCPVSLGTVLPCVPEYTDEV